jgi:hypothetical protein
MIMATESPTGRGTKAMAAAMIAKVLMVDMH